MADDDIRDDSASGLAGFRESGYSILIEKENVLKFMEDGDYSSSKSLDLFEQIGSDLDDRVKELHGGSFFAFSVAEEKLSRDFTVLQIAHFLSKRGKSVLVVDCDFLNPGLNGLVENIEELGFLDLFLYGSSLKTVARPTGIEGVQVVGPGSFPVSRTVPFAKKEFSRVNDFLRKRGDVVIYCSTLYTDDGVLNPLAKLVDGVILAFRIEDTEEGQLQRSHSDLEAMGVSAVETICFCSTREAEEAVSGRKLEPVEHAEGKKVEGEATIEGVKDEGGISVEEEREQEIEKGLKSGVIEKTGEIITDEGASKKGLSIFRIATIVAAVLVVAFISWWVLVHKSIRENDRSDRIDEVVQKVREAGKDVSDEREAETGVAEEYDESADAEDRAGLGDGSAEVEEEPKEVAAEPAEQPEGAAGEEPVEEETSAVSSELYAVHIASFRDINRAGLEAEYFENEGYKVRVKEVKVKGGKWFRVLVGGFASKEEAGKARIELLSYKRIGYARVVRVGEGN